MTQQSCHITAELQITQERQWVCPGMDGHVVYLALYEDNTDLCLHVSLLLCVNNADFTVCEHVYIHVCSAL